MHISASGSAGSRPHALRFVEVVKPAPDHVPARNTRRAHSGSDWSERPRSRLTHKLSVGVATSRSIGAAETKLMQCIGA